MSLTLPRGLASFTTRKISCLLASSALAPVVLSNRVLGCVLVTSDAVGLSSIDPSESVSTKNVDTPGHRLKMINDRKIPGRSDANRIFTKMINMKTLIDGAMRVDPRGTVRVTRGAFRSAFMSELSVICVRVGRRRPHPARTQIRAIDRKRTGLVHLDPERLLGSRKIVGSGAPQALVMHRTDFKVSVSSMIAAGKHALRLCHERQFTPWEGVVMNLYSPLGECNA